MSPLLGWLLGGLSLLLLPGCSHYRLGTEGALAFRTLYVAPVENAAPVPQASALVGTQLREALLRDARVSLVNDPAEAEATLSVRLVRYERTVATVRPDDTGLARKLELTLAAVCTLRDNRSGTVLFTDRPLDSRRQAFTDSGQLQAEYQTLPLLATALAQNVARAVLDTW